MSSSYIPEGKVFIQKETLINIADAIRKKTGKSGKIKTGDMITTVDSIERGADYFSGSVTELTAEDFAGVTEICDYAFAGYKNLKSVTIPNSVKRIGAAAFKDCVNLESVIIPDSVIHIGKEAFNNTALYKNPHNWINGSLYIDRCLISGNVDVSILQVESGTRLIAEDAIVAIPSTSIYDMSPLKEIYLPDSVKSLSDRAINNIHSIYNASSSITLSLADTIEAIGECALGILSVTLRSAAEIPCYVIDDDVLFTADMAQLVRYMKSNASLTSYTVPDGVTSIAGGAFRSISNLELALPETIKYIGKYAFAACGVSTLSIPASVEYIDVTALDSCTSISEFSADNDNKNYCCIDGVLFNKDMTDLLKYPSAKANTTYTIPESVIRIMSGAFQNASKLQEVISGDLLETIGEQAFVNCTSLKSASFGSGIVTIDQMAFKSCTSLESVLFAKSPKYIKDSAFESCTSLSTVSWTAGLESIGNKAFYQCLFTDITFPNTLKSIGHQAFSECNSLKSIDIPDNVTSLLEASFQNCSSLETVIIGGGITNLGPSIFYSCENLKNVTIKDGLSSLSPSMFYYCQSLTFIELPNSIQTIGAGAFAESALGSIKLSEGLATIETGAFRGCSGLTSIDIPESVTYIGGNAFGYCSNLVRILIPASVTMLGSSPSESYYYTPNVFDACIRLEEVQVDENNTVYASIDGVLFTKDVSELIYCPPGAFRNTYSIPESVIVIRSNAFERCLNLSDITIPDGVASIGSAAFSGCTSLSSITIPGSVTSIGNSAFYGCNGLESITIPDSVTSIGSSAFAECSGLKSVIIGNSVTGIELSTFYNCTSLESIEIGNTVANIGTQAFYNCTSLTTITIPDSVTFIDGNAFYNNTSLESIYIGKSLKTLDMWLVSYNEPLPLTRIDISPDNNYFTSEDGIVFSKDMSTLIAYPSMRKDSTYTVPETVSMISDAAFNFCLLQALILEGNDIKQISTNINSGWGLFRESDISHIYIKSTSMSSEEVAALVEKYRNHAGWKDWYMYHNDREIKSYDEYVEPPVRYMVTFCPNGNDDFHYGDNLTMLVNEGEVLTNADDMSSWPQNQVPSYTWYTDPDCTEVFDIYSTPITSDMTLYLKGWYTVTFHANGVESWPYDMYQVNVPMSHNQLLWCITEPEHTDFYNLAINYNWYSEPECICHNNLDTSVYRDMDLYLNPAEYNAPTES